MDSLTPAQRSAAERRLETGERLLWAAGPSSGMLAGALLPGCVAIPFLLFGGWPLIVAIRNLPTVFEGQNGFLAFLVFAGFGLVFVGVGLLAMRHAVRQRRDLAATVWAVTDRRFFKLVERPGRRVLEAVPLRLVTGVDLVEYADGSGSLTVTTDAPQNNRRRGAGPRRGQYVIMGVRDAAAAHATIQAQVDRAVAAGGDPA